MIVMMILDDGENWLVDGFFSVCCYYLKNDINVVELVWILKLQNDRVMWVMYVDFDYIYDVDLL